MVVSQPFKAGLYLYVCMVKFDAKMGNPDTSY